MRKILVLLAIVAVIAFGVHLILKNSHARQAQGAPPRAAVPVTAAPVRSETVPLELKTFGTVQALSTVDVKSQIGGVLTKVHIQEGQEVQAGDLLFTIDPRPMKAAVDQAEANLARDRVQRENAEKEAQRQEDLLKKGLTAEDVSEQSRTTAKAFAAAVKADEAALENARLQIEYCSIRSPITGRTGDQVVHQGNLVKANDVTLLTINQIEPIQVSFSVPQQELPVIKREMALSKLEVRAIIPGADGTPEKGELTFVNNMVDQTTGTIQLKGTFPNSSRRLWPGQFVNTVLNLAVQSNALVVPSQAIQTGQKGSYVFIIKPDMTVEARPVEVERSFDSMAIVRSGLQAMEQVVTDGQLRLTPGVAVSIKSEGETPKTSTP